jgi:magnesium-transporting ATPase (P-type)
MWDEDLDARAIAALRELQQPSQVRPDPPPLRIHHLMVCAAVAAIELSLLRYMLNWSPQSRTIVSGGVFGFTQVLNAVGLTLFGFSFYWWRKGYAAFTQPGQMLLLQYAASLLLYLFSMAFALTMRSTGVTTQSPSWFSWMPIMMGMGGLLFGVLLPVVFYGWCAWKVADTWPWRLLFVLCAVAALLTSTLTMMLAQYSTYSRPNIQSLFAMPHLLRGSMLFAAGVLAVASDLAAQRKRSWTHWAALLLWLFGQIGTLLTGFYYMYFWRIV